MPHRKLSAQNPRSRAVSLRVTPCQVRDWWYRCYEPRMSRAGGVIFYALLFCILICLTGKTGKSDICTYYLGYCGLGVHSNE